MRILLVDDEPGAPRAASRATLESRDRRAWTRRRPPPGRGPDDARDPRRDRARPPSARHDGPDLCLRLKAAVRREHPDRAADRCDDLSRRGARRRRRRAPAEAVQPARSARARRAPLGRRHGLTAAASDGDPGRRGAASALRARPAAPARDRAPASAGSCRARTERRSSPSRARWSRRTPARARTPIACRRLRSSSPPHDRHHPHRGSGRGVRLPAARRRQDRHPGPGSCSPARPARRTRSCG